MMLRAHTVRRHAHRRHLAALLAAVLLAVLAVPLLAGATPAQAADNANFKPGMIITDDLFYDGRRMNAAQVQAFLNEKGADCAPSGDLACLKDYRDETRDWEADSYCKGYTAGVQTAAEIIAGVGASCGVNPQTLIVLLQKEQSLINRATPSARAYQIATGYGCPDTAPCDEEYYGFFNQVYRAARQFKVYQANPDRYGYRAGRTNTITYHPSGQCGTSEVYIENQATAGLYIYTPHQPNDALLAGKPDDCSSYGNLNFWRFMTDWFGMRADGTAPAVGAATRISGADRYATSAAISADAFSTAGTVFISSGATFPDALAGSAAAAVADAPMLLVSKDGVPSSVAGELKRLRPGRIVVLGGDGTVAPHTLDALTQYSPKVERLAGADRYTTAAAISSATFSSSTDTVYIADGTNHADALAGSAAAGANGSPVLLVRPTAVPGATAEELDRLNPRRIVVLGGPASVSEEVLQSLGGYAKEVTRIHGADRYATAAALSAATFSSSAPAAYLAAGQDFPDALSGAAAAAASGGPVLLVRQTCPPAVVTQELRPALPATHRRRRWARFGERLGGGLAALGLLLTADADGGRWLLTC